MSEKSINRLKNKVYEAVTSDEEEELTAAQKFFKKFPPERKMVLLTDIFGIEGAENWTRQEIESYFDRNAENIFDAAINEKEIRDFLGVDKETLISISKDEEGLLDELVDDDGTLVGGGQKSGRPRHTNDSEIWTAPQQTTADYAKGVSQPRRFYAMGGTPYSHGSIGAMESEKKEGEYFLKERNIRKMVEDILSKRTNRNDIVRNKRPSDINKNKIPDIEELFRNDNKASVATNTNYLIRSINDNELTGEEIGMVLNAILMNTDTEQIPEQFKEQLKKNI